MKRAFLKTLVAVAALAAFGLAQAQTKTIKFANQNAEGHPVVLGMKKFAELVEQKSGGKLKVNVFPAARWAATRPTSPRCRAARWKWLP